MSDDSLAVIEKSVAMFLVILVGWLARRRGYIDAPTTSLLSTLTTDIALPALIFTQMLASVNREVLRENLLVPLLAAGVLILGHAIAFAARPLFATRTQAPTFIFVVGIANWIYLPLPIVQALYGIDGVRILLLCNVGVQVTLWTLGIAILHGGRLDRAALQNLIRNPGLIATLAGIAIALYPPTLPDTASRAVAPAVHAILDALTLLGSLTIPLSLLVTGAQLGAIPARAKRDGDPARRALAGIVILRLAITPLIALALLYAAIRFGLRVPRLALAIPFLISTMPVAISCSILAERFKQDTPLAARAIFWTTLLGLLTVPILFGVFNWLTDHSTSISSFGRSVGM